MKQLSGICGVVAAGGRQVQSDELNIMAATVPHRTTGGMGRSVCDQAALVQLYRAPGARPRSSEDGGALEPWVDPFTGTVVVADARIDNGDELARTLGREAPNSDQDAIPLIGAAYRRWGLDCLPRLIGDFAVAIWDPARGRLALARDPMAMRALYYRREPDRILFATEVKQLLALPGVPTKPDERMVACYLAGSFGDLEWTYWEGIHQVRPGHVTVWNEGSVRSIRCWNMEADGPVGRLGAAELRSCFREAFLEAVRARARSASRSGVFLSGGIDSGAIASALGFLRGDGRLPGSEALAYSWDFGRFAEADERHISRLITQAYGIPSRELPVEDLGPLAGYPTDSAPDLDDPLHTPFHAVLDQGWRRSEADGVGVLFTGFRGDLMVGPLDLDYPRLARAGRWRDLNAELEIEAELRSMPLATIALMHAGSFLAHEARRLGSALRRLSPPDPRDAPDPAHERHRKATLPWIPRDLAYRVDLEGLLHTHLELPPPPLEGPLRQRRFQVIFSPVNLRWAVAQERRTARFNQQAADPWSDVRIAELCAGMPQQVMDPDGTGDKPFPREALAGVLPEGFRKNARKIRPSPLYRAALLGPAKESVRELLHESVAASKGWLQPLALWRAFESFVDGGALPGEFWWAISLEWWLRGMEGGTRPPRPENEPNRRR
jgi:asparagine synthase (glutamine-hydrolysing)